MQHRTGVCLRAILITSSLAACGRGADAFDDAASVTPPAPTAPTPTVEPPRGTGAPSPRASQAIEPPTGQGAPSGEGVGPVGDAASRAVAPSGDIAWTAPATWTEEPPASSMRRAQYRLPETGDAGSAECAIFHFPGGGSVDDNINRWLTQFEGSDGAPIREPSSRDERVVNGLVVTVVEASGTYLAQNPPMTGPVEHVADSALFGAVIVTAGAPYFVKCVGPTATIAAHRNDLNAFVDSFRRAELVAP